MRSPVDGGTETALTTGSGISDDPDYSPDGKYIYFNSDRTGAMEIWRMLADGSKPEQVTFDGLNSWTPHPSPDGTSILILSYGKGVTGHPANKDVTLRILNAGDGKVRDLVESWADQAATTCRTGRPTASTSRLSATR